MIVDVILGTDRPHIFVQVSSPEGQHQGRLFLEEKNRAWVAELCQKLVKWAFR